MALVRHSGIYFLARILAGGAGFVIIASYTRLLDPHEFGELALLAAFFSTDEAGLYAAGYDLQMNLLGVPLVVMQLAGYSLVMSAFAERGTQAAQTQLRLLSAVIILIVLPEAAGMVMTGPLLVHIFLGSEFRPLNETLMPLLVCATFIKVLLNYVTYGYFLGARSDLTLLAFATAAVVDVAANLVLIPHYGAWGAALASLCGFGAGFAMAAMTVRRVFPFPQPDPAILLAGIVGAGAMALWLLPFYHGTSWTSALFVIPIAVVIYFGSVLLLLRISGSDPFELMRALWGEQTKGAT